MNKKIIGLFAFISLLFCGSSVLASATLINPIGYDTFGDLLTKGILPTVSGIAGSLAVVAIIIAGIFYLTSAGSPTRIETAKKALIYAIVGIVIAIGASAITSGITGMLGAPSGGG